MHHDYFFRRGFESVRAQFLSAERNITCNLTVHLSQLSSCWIWHLTFSWVQILSNKFESFVSCNIKLFTLCFDMYIFYQNLREGSFLMPGTRAEKYSLAYENCSSWDPGVWNSGDVQDRGMKTYSIIYPRGQGVRKLLGNFLRGTKLFKPKLRNSTIRICLVMHIY